MPSPTAALVAITVALAGPGAAAPPGPASRPATRPASTSIRPTLDPGEQALGWWMTSAGAVAVAAGGFAFGVSQLARGRTRDLQVGAGTALVTLGAAFFASGVYLLAFDLPGPCETSGTGIDGPASGPASRPFGATRLLIGPTGIELRARF